MKKLLFSIITIALFALPSGTAMAAFNDVGTTHDNYEGITWLEENGVIVGYSDGGFHPDQAVNRVEFLKMLYKTIDASITTDSAAAAVWQGKFNDVDEGEWYWPYLEFALVEETVKGYPDGLFRPASEINYAEAAKIVANAYFDLDSWYDDSATDFGECTLNETNYRDAWYWHYIGYLDEQCIFPDEIAAIDTNDHPALTVTRGQMAEMLYRAKAVRDNNDDYSNLDFVELDEEPTPIGEIQSETPELPDPTPGNELYSNTSHGLLFEHPEEWQQNGDSVGNEDLAADIDFDELGEDDIDIMDWFGRNALIRELQITQEIAAVNAVLGEDFWVREDIIITTDEGTNATGHSYAHQKRINKKPGLNESTASTTDCYYLANTIEVYELCATVETGPAGEALLDEFADLVDTVDFF